MANFRKKGRTIHATNRNIALKTQFKAVMTDRIDKVPPRRPVMSDPCDKPRSFSWCWP